MTVALIIYGNLDKVTGGYIYNKKIVKHLEAKGVKVNIVSLRELPYFINFIWNLWLFFYFLRKSYDVILEDELNHVSLFLFNFLIKKKTKAKIVSIVHLLHWLEVPSWYAWLVKWLEKQMLCNNDLVVANSQYTKSQLLAMGLSEKTIKVVYPGFNLPVQAGLKEKREEDKVKLLFVANCIPRKGLNYLIEALYILKKANLFLDIVGDESIAPFYIKKLKKKIKKYKLENQVTFWGKVPWDSIFNFYINAHIFIVPSLYEAYGIVFAEAASFGLPIIATKTGGIPEIVKDKKMGVLVPPGNVSALVAAIRKLSESQELRESYGKQSYQKATSLPSWEETGELIYRLLENVAR